MQKFFMNMNKKRCMAAAVCLALMITAGMPAGVSAEAVDVQLPSSGGAVSGPLLADTITAYSGGRQRVQLFRRLPPGL